MLSKLQAAAVDEIDGKIGRLMRRNWMGHTLRLARCVDVLKAGRALQIHDYQQQSYEPDVAWLVPDLHPGSHHIYRVAVQNKFGSSVYSEPSVPTRMSGSAACVPSAVAVVLCCRLCLAGEASI